MHLINKRCYYVNKAFYYFVIWKTQNDRGIKTIVNYQKLGERREKVKFKAFLGDNEMVKARCMFKRLYKTTQYKETLTVHKYLKVVSEIRKFQRRVNIMIRVYKTVKSVYKSLKR